MNISFNAVGHDYLTFACPDTATEGYPCKIASNETVSDADSGDNFFGIISAMRDGSARVLFRGYHEIVYTGTAPTVGYGILVADGTGGVKTGTTGKSYWIVNVDSTNKIVGFFL